jgi:hypothetical protein
MGSLLETSAFPAAMKEFFRGCGARPIDFVLANQPFRLSVRRMDGTTKAFDLPAPVTWRPRKERNVAFKDLGGGFGYIRR